MKKILINATASFAMSLFALAAHAEQTANTKGMDMGGMKMGSSGAQSSSTFGVNEGEVKAVDAAKKRIIIKHGHIKSKTVEMGPMTMTFLVQQPSLLSNVKAGDKIKFVVENDNNVATVTSLTVQK